MWLSVLLAILIAYLLGNLNGAVIISRLIGTVRPPHCWWWPLTY